MTGTPALFPLESVNVIIAGTGMVVLDQQNKLLWKATLGYPVPEGANPADSPTGQGPCVEHDGTVYVYDKAMLTAFDLATGNARWRFPSVGVVGLFFDEQGMIYVNSTTAGLDTVKYSRQIDISSSSHPLILKLDAKAGTKLWASEDTGLLTYVSGKFLYALSSYQPEEPDDSNPYGHPDTGLEAPPCVKISRLNPKNGAQMWEYFEQRAPLSAGFDRNLIRLVFRKEVEVLKYTSF
jgi:outer membrane protein assembly factor BamB